MSAKKKFRLTRRTILRDIIQNKAETVGDKVYMTFLRDFDNNIEEKYTYRDMHLYARYVKIKI